MALSKSHASLFGVTDTLDLSLRSSGHVGINAVAQGLRFMMQVGSTILLARLLTPEDFGLVAMVVVLVNFVALFQDAGLAQATVQRRAISHDQISTLFWLNCGLTLFLGSLVAALAPVIVWIYGEPRLFGLSLLLALPIALSGLWLQHRALLQRHMRFLAIARVEVLSAALGVAVGVFAAMAGAGYWALAFMALTTSVAATLGYWSETRWRPGRPQRDTGVRPMLRFGANLTGFNFVNYFARNADNFLIGKFIGTAALGQYSRAYSLMVMPLAQINGPLGSALLPALSALQSDAEGYRRLYLKYLKWVAWLTLLPIAGASYFGAELIRFLLGSEWELAGQIFEWLAVASFLQPVTHYNSLLFISLGRTRQMFLWGVLSSASIVLGFALSVTHGVLTLAMVYAWIVVGICLVQPFYALRGSPVALREYFRTVGTPLSIALVLALGSRLF